MYNLQFYSLAYKMCNKEIMLEMSIPVVSIEKPAAH